MVRIIVTFSHVAVRVDCVSGVAGTHEKLTLRLCTGEKRGDVNYQLGID